MKSVFTAILMLVLCSALSAQIKSGFGPGKPIFETEAYFINPLVFFDIDTLSPRLDIFIEVPRSNILFSKKNGKYSASFGISISLLDRNGSVIFQKSRDESFSFGENEIKKELEKSEFYVYNHFLSPGEYSLESVLKDKNSKKESRRTVAVKVKNYSSAPITLSDIMLVSELTAGPDGTKEMTPLISNNVFGYENFYLFFEIYNNTESPKSGVFTYRIIDRDDNAVSEGFFDYALSERKTSVFQKIAIGSVFRELFALENMDPEEMSKKGFGVFKLILTDKTSQTVVAEKRFTMLPEKPLMPQMHPGFKE